MISLLNAVLPRGEALLIWLFDTLCRMHKGPKLANTLTSLKPQGSKNPKQNQKKCNGLLYLFTYLFIYLIIYFSHRRRKSRRVSTPCGVCLRGARAIYFCPPTLPSEIIYSIAGLSATSHYMATTVSWRKV